jgi:hypothetical protein
VAIVGRFNQRRSIKVFCNLAFTGSIMHNHHRTRSPLGPAQK